MKNTFLSLFILMFLLTPAVALAKSGGDDRHENDRHGDDHAKVDIRIKTQNIGNKVEIEDEDEHQATNQGRLRFEVKNNKFEIRGAISSVGDNSFVIGGQTIRISPATTGKFEQKGNIAVGAFAKVEGIIINNIFFAKEIKIEGQGKLGTPPARFKFEIKDVRQNIPVSTISASPSAFPAATASANTARIDIRARGPVDQVIKFLESVLTALKNLV